MSILAISPLDGRYQTQTRKLAYICSEYGLIYHRVFVEIAWLKSLVLHLDIVKEGPFVDSQVGENTRADMLATKGTDVDHIRGAICTILDNIVADFSESSAQRVKELEKTTNHDVKAVEYYLREELSKQLALHDLMAYSYLLEYIHFACTSEDINNLSYALMIKKCLHDELLPQVGNIEGKLLEMAHRYADLPMLARTHGQPATPTTVGKEFANVYIRIKRQIATLKDQSILGKINGAVGNYNAHCVAFPEVDWVKFGSEFISGLGLTPNLFTTQIEPHDFIAEIADNIARINTIIIDLNRDIWGYVSFNYFNQKLVEGEIGSSTMPHKVNPIDFENSEGNLGLANAILEHLARKLPVSRFQRDLTDSTVLRNLGVAFGHCVLGYSTLLRGLTKLELNISRITEDLDGAPEVLGEALQTVMRRYQIEGGYERLKSATRGKKVSIETLRLLVDGLPLPEDTKNRLNDLTPQAYIGLAEVLARRVEDY